MSTDPSGGPLFGSGGYYGAGGGPGGGGFGGFGGFRPFGARGPYGAYPTCGCSSFFIILAGVLLIIGGCLRAFNF
jgi:hypothetical protein